MFKCKHLPPKHKVTCELTNLIYIINCKKCGHQYIGETKRPFRNRMYEHHSSVQKFSTDKSTPVSRHFSQKDHSVKHMEFSILHWMGDPINPNTTNRRRSQELTNLIYIINCKKCGHQYIGETKRPFRNRMYEHHSSVQKFSTDKSTPVSRHFSQKDHSVKHMEFSILHWMGDPINPNTTNRRRSQELYYIWAFPTLHPAGINMFV